MTRTHCRCSFAGPPARALFVAVAAGALGACTVVRVGDGSAVRTTLYPGVAVVNVAPGNSTQVVEVEAIGPAIVGNQASFGWLSSQMALIPEGRCHLIMWRATESALFELRNLLGPDTRLCTQEGEER